MSPEAGLDALVRRYLEAFGPATAKQFAQWVGAPKSWIAPPFDHMESIMVADSHAFVAPGDAVFPQAPPSGVRLLPYFDNYQVGSHPRALLFSGKAAERALSGGAAGVFPVILHRGVVAGVWHQRRSGRKLHITVETIEHVPRGDLDEQVELVATVLEGNAEVTLGTVTVGPHA
jgi:hypothetical protein